jgi:hypothetical protein
MNKWMMAAVAMFAANSANAAVIDFENFAAGDILSTFGIAGVGVTVTATGGSGDAMIFDSRSYTGGDSDLQAPFYEEFTGTSHNGTPVAGTATLNPGNILIVSEDGDSSDPDDNGSGGTITFNFTSRVMLTGFDVLDDVTNFSVTTNNGPLVSGLSLDYNNQFLSYSNIDQVGVNVITFDFGNASGAIDNISFEIAPVPVPASLPLFLAGMGAFGLAARRARRKS